MRVLMLFLDMVRPNRLKLFDEKNNYKYLDKLIFKLGGTLYTNCYSPAPDTPRSMACFYTGLLPFENGCDTRVKWPGKFLKDKPNIFDPFIKNNYNMNFFSNPNERQGGLFPPGIDQIGAHNTNYDLDKYLKELKLKDKHLVFIGIPDFHWALQDWGYNLKAEKVAEDEIEKTLKIIFQNLNEEDFDYIFVFSDHGFKFNAQVRLEKSFQFLDRDRSNIFMFLRKKGDNKLTKSNKLCSIQDLKHTIYDLFGLESTFSLLNGSERKYVVLEDHMSISAPKINQNIHIWGVANKDSIYVRDLQSGFLIKKNGLVNNGINNEYDNILKQESQFGKYINEHNKVFEYKKLILAQTNYMNGGARLKESPLHKIYRIYHILKDHLKLILNYKL